MAKEAMDKGFNDKLDEVIESRRSIRAFTDEMPPRESIKAIIRPVSSLPMPHRRSETRGSSGGSSHSPRGAARWTRS